MTRAERFVRRNEVDERVAIAIAAVAGVTAAFAGAEPTGGAVVDVVLVAGAVAAVVWAAASAPWWAPTVAAGIGASVALDPIVAAAGLGAFVAGMVIGLRNEDQSALRAIVAAVAMNVLVRSDLDGFHGLSALVGIALGVLLVVVGLRRRPSRIRRFGWLGAGVVAGVGVLAVLALGVSAASARPDLTSGARQARQAITALNAGEYQRAADLFESSAVSFARSDDRLAGTLAAPSRLVPVVAQNVRAGAELSAAASAGLAEAASALRSIDVDSLGVTEGRVDLAAVAALEAPLLQVEEVLGDLRSARDDITSPWLLAPVNDELVELDERLDAAEPLAANALDAVRLAPDLLGAAETRRYLVLFTTPVEARGLAGFVGNYAVVEADEGSLSVPEFGRRSDLEQVVSERGAVCSGCPAEMLERYGRFGLTGGTADDGFAPRGWSSLTLPAHFPYVGEAAGILFPQSGGQPIDGVIAMDPFVVQALMRYTGPIEVPELGLTVTPADADEFLLRGQYDFVADDLDGNEDRVDALETLGTETIRRLLAGSLPPPADLARDLGPLVAERRLLMWGREPAERDFFGRVGLDGALPELGDDGGFALMATNHGHSKIDYYLDRTVDVAVETDGDRRTLVADVTLTNDAPASGLPSYVIGNSYGFESGTSYLWLNFFGPEGLLDATRNGEPMELQQSTEAGWQAYERYEAIGAGQTVEFRLVFELGADVDGVDEPVVWEQPLASRTVT